MKVTERLMQTLDEWRATGYGEAADKLHEDVSRLVNHALRLDDIARADLYHSIMSDDVGVFVSSPKAPSCKAGCSACCYQQVMITEGEAKLLVHKYASLITDELKEKIKVQASWSEDPNEWRKHYPECGCVFLKDHKCSVYEDRPMACRNLLVSSDPSLCDVRVDNQVELLSNVEKEAVISAAVNTDVWSNMPRQLAKVLNV